MIHVVMSTSEAFLDYMTVAIWSLMLNSLPDTEYRVSVLYLEIAEAGIEKCRQRLSVWKNLRLDFICIKPFVDKYRLDYDKVKALPTCYTLLSGEIFPEEERIISLDSDLIVKRDLTGLWNTPLGGNIIAGAVDADFSGQFNSGNGEYLDYYKHFCRIPDPGSYIQAGVLVYNLPALRAAFSAGELFIATCSGAYKFDDQDVLNKYCAGRIMLLDMRWNVVHDNLASRVPYIISLAPEEVRAQYAQARKEPWIIHYAGCEKPWNSQNCDMGGEFWSVAALSPIPADALITPAFNEKGLKKSAEQKIRKLFRRIRFLIRKRRMKLK